MLFALKSLGLRRLDLEFAVRNVLHPFKDGMNCKDQYQGYIKRHPQVSVRVPEQKKQNWEKAAIQTSNPYFKDLKDKHNPTLDPNNVISRRDNFLETVDQDQSSNYGYIPQKLSQGMKKIRHTCSVTKYFKNRNSEQSG
jgi:hypothetical protein